MTTGWHYFSDVVAGIVVYKNREGDAMQLVRPDAPNRAKTALPIVRQLHFLFNGPSEEVPEDQALVSTPVEKEIGGEFRFDRMT